MKGATMPDLGTLLGGGGIVTLILGAGALLRWYVARRDAKKDPIPKDAAAVALAQSGVALMQGVADRLDGELAEVRTELAVVRAENAQNATRMQSLEASIETLDSALSAAVGYIESLIRYMRSGAHGPEPIVPERLRDLLDPLLQGWGRATD